LDGPNDPVEYDEDMLNVAADFYKKTLMLLDHHRRELLRIAWR
jgi:hypothetical protein